MVWSIYCIKDNIRMDRRVCLWHLRRTTTHYELVNVLFPISALGWLAVLLCDILQFIISNNETVHVDVIDSHWWWAKSGSSDRSVPTNKLWPESFVKSSAVKYGITRGQ